MNREKTFSKLSVWNLSTKDQVQVELNTVWSTVGSFHWTSQNFCLEHVDCVG